MCESLLGVPAWCASTNTIYFQVLGMMSAINFWLAPMTCLYSSPFMCVNKSALCCGALPFDNHLEMHLQNGSIFCILSRASCLSAVRGFVIIFCVVSTVVKSGVTVSLMGWVFEGSVSVVVWWWCDVLLLVLNTGPSKFVAVSILTVALLSFDSVTKQERQLAAFFMLLISIWTWYCRLQVPVPICWPCYWHSFHLGIWLVVCGHCGLWCYLLEGNNSIW